MSQFFKVLKADPMGEPYTPNVPNAKPIQSYWCQVEGQNKAVMIGKQVRDDGQPALYPGQHVYGDLMYAKSQKGNEYWKFKSAQIPEGVQRPADSPAQAQAQAATGSQPQGMVGDTPPGWFIPYGNMIKYIYDEMKKMDTDNPENQANAALEPPVQEPQGVEQVAGEPIDPETQATLDNIFGGEPPEPEDK